MKGKASDAGSSFTIEEKCPWEGVLWNKPAKLQTEQEGPGLALAMTVFSNDVRCTKKIQFNDFVHNSFVKYNSELWEVLRQETVY